MGKVDQLLSRRHACFIVNMANMRLYRTLRQIQVFGNIRSASPKQEHPQYLLFTWRQRKALGGLTQPPFYAAEIVPTYQGTKGGIQINENGQAINMAGNPIPRLYACGNTTGCGTPGKYYTGAGGTNGPGMVFAYLAAEHAGQLDSWA